LSTGNCQAAGGRRQQAAAIAGCLLLQVQPTPAISSPTPKRIATASNTHVGLARGADRRREHHRAAVRRGKPHPGVKVGDKAVVRAPPPLFYAHHGALSLGTQSHHQQQHDQQERGADCCNDQAPGVPAERRPPPDRQEDAADGQLGLELVEAGRPRLGGTGCVGRWPARRGRWPGAAASLKAAPRRPALAGASWIWRGGAAAAQFGP
jgi:hypothetical protein